ncbi:MAG TPA: hypothetical protein VII69_04590 [Candidatus Eremiobacteraceae bacterium]
MSLDGVASLSQIGTFIVIAATAVIAVVQLRHLRSGNQVQWMRGLAQDYEGAEFRDAFHFVRSELAECLKEPPFRKELRSGPLDRSEHPEVVILNLFETWGRCYRAGAVDRKAFVAQFCRVIVSHWDVLEPAIALIATRTGGVNTFFGSFEYLTVQARAWMTNNPRADYPIGAPRIPLRDPWANEDGVALPSEV